MFFFNFYFGKTAIWLASLGYDVWLTNQRGTRYSRAHKTLSSAGYKYWLYRYIPKYLSMFDNFKKK